MRRTLKTGRKDRLSPPLMFVFRAAHEQQDAKKRLDVRDEAGDRVIALRRRTGHKRVITEPLLRREVARDLEHLMNVVALESTQDLSAFPHVRRSILNFGCPDISHRTINDAELGGIADEIEAALRIFEPRLSPGTIKVERDLAVDPVALKIRFVIRADLECHPVDVPVEFVADVEFDTGKIMVARK